VKRPGRAREARDSGARVRRRGETAKTARAPRTESRPRGRSPATARAETSREASQVTRRDVDAARRMPSKSKNASAASKEAKQLEKLQAELERKKAKLDALMKSGAARANAQPARPSPRVADISSVFRGISSRASRARSPRNVASSAVSARRRRLDRSIYRPIDSLSPATDASPPAGRPLTPSSPARVRTPSVSPSRRRPKSRSRSRSRSRARKRRPAARRERSTSTRTQLRAAPSPAAAAATPTAASGLPRRLAPPRPGRRPTVAASCA
jgi:hypothetical protein